MPESRLCRIYRSPRREGMYVYVAQEADLERMPEALRQRFGPPAFALQLLLTPQRRLARADAGDVLAAIAERGFYLQMPPGDNALNKPVAP